jgi:putative flavoprotein involved in K+ transport
MMINQALDVLIIGGAQAGLAIGYALKDSRLRFNLVESHKRIGDGWRNRYDSLVLFTPRSLSSLPGLALDGDPDEYAGKDEFADYLERYACHFNLPIRLGTGVQALSHTGDGFRAVTTNGEIINARAVILATGGFQAPSVPAFAKQFSANVIQLTTATYKNPSQIPSRKMVLVVGDGASGRDFANELCADHTVYLATGKKRKLLPEKILGKPSLYWLNKIGALQAPPSTPLGRYLKKTDGFLDRGQGIDKLQRKGIRIRPKLEKAQGQRAIFADQSSAEVAAVIWAIGYHDHSAWVCIPEIKDEHGNFIHNQGISPVTGLFFIGRPWQRSRGSAFIGGVGIDAEHIAQHVTQYLQKEAA